MTVTSSTTRLSFTATGTGPFNISALGISSDDDVLVTKVDTDASESTLVKTTDYTINSDLTELTLVSALTSGQKLVVTLSVTLTQGTNFTNTSSQNFENAETALDKLTLIAKEHGEVLDRSFKLSVGSSGVSATLPSPTANNFIAWNQTATGLTNKTSAEVISLTYSGSVIVDTFNDGTDFTAGSSTQITLSSDPGVENNTQVFFDGVYKAKSTYSISGTVITFGSAIPGGTSVIEVVHTETNVLNAPAAGSVGSTTVSSEMITGQSTAAAALTDTILLSDTSDSGNLKESTVQSVIDLANPNNQANATIAAGDKILFSDASDSNTLKEDSAQGILDLLNPNSLTNATITASDKILFSDASDSNTVKEDSVQGVLDLVSPTGYVFLATTSASSSASVSFASNIDSTYDVYKIIAVGVISQTDGVDMYARTSANGGSSYDSGASDYLFSGNDSTSNLVYNSSGATHINMINPAGNGHDNSTSHPLNFELTLMNPSNASTVTTMLGSCQYIDASSGVPYTSDFTGYRNSAAAVDAIQFLFSSGNIVSGDFYLYGLIKS